MKVLEREVQSQRPKKLVLHIAGNDIDSPHADEDSVKEVVLKLMALCDLFVSRYRVNSAYICQLVPRLQLDIARESSQSQAQGNSGQGNSAD